MSTHPLTITGWEHVSSGKIRDIYAPAGTLSSGKTPDRYLMVTSDRISAYDYIMPSLIPDKGKILNQLAIWWMEQLSDIIDTHLLRDQDGKLLPVPENVRGRAVICRALNMIPVECVVRGYLTGSGLAEYEATGSVCGIPLPEGLSEASALTPPIFTPAVKADIGEHDENVSFQHVADMIGNELAEKLRDTSLALYARARTLAAERGIILADTKYEFGCDPQTGTLVLADEILTPDSSRFWPADQWHPGRKTPSFDKQYLRDWLTSPQSHWDKNTGEKPPHLPEHIITATQERYCEAFRKITGKEPQLS
ncbi:phosphoribosylaminoimidazolesuccinocarboxamide synthase [Schaalia sp. lx-100]|uniref:phosphoribosylaminoimidazolesuccinocarboxamide synthase n=1 Tax=Schaalia sp. lx-100 TaxID=2899081 RepID=UPI001E608843|nr:phosphoribosylaminoimidazolesuccinocarboxamide synthase [Schaalia sp. lx-100]MCD4557576.1 phosphoribosylaminoimidazolesuccinocarboxamide synthase [Schaalia sp. lx-100]